jgi:hypothetical protein
MLVPSVTILPASTEDVGRGRSPTPFR